MNYLNIWKHLQDVITAIIGFIGSFSNQPFDHSQYKLNYNFIPNRPPLRLISIPVNDVLPTQIDLSDNLGVPYDQGQLGSCVSNGIAKCLEYNLRVSDKINYLPSRLFIYYNGRVLGKFPINRDTGLNIVDGVSSIEMYSACEEVDFPYDITKFAVKPNTKCYIDAHKYKLYTFYSIEQNLTKIKQTLNIKLPVVLGIAVYSSFVTQQVAKTGIIPDPNTQTEELVGGHCITLVGYDDSTQKFKFVNSWGQWGDKGYGYISYKYITNTNLTSELYVLTNFKSLGLV
jgi:C1A family cysteine protease